MKKLQWNMEEVFYFPENVGVPKDARLVKVKAGFTEKRSEDAVRLSGIYHIAAKVNFTEGQRKDSLPTDAVFVDDVELEGETGYFEYAVPLYIDLPPEVEHPLHIEATDVKSAFDGQGGFTVAWNVNCTYGQESTKETASNEQASTETATKDTAFNQTVAKDPVKNETVANEPANDKPQTMEANKESELVEERKETAVVQESLQAEAATELPVQEQVAQVTETQLSSAAQKQTATAPVQERQATAVHDSSSWNDHDDMLSYIATLPDEWTTTRFRSNDIFVKEEN